MRKTFTISRHRALCVFDTLSALMMMHMRNVQDKKMSSGEQKEYKIGISKQNGEWGFIPTRNIVELASIMLDLKLDSKEIKFVDLGSGPGTLLLCLSIFFDKMHFVGYDNESLFVDNIGFLDYPYNVKLDNVKLEKKDLLRLTKIDIESADVFYMYEPFSNGKKAKDFVDNLVPLLKSGQIIIYNHAGNIGEFLSETGQFKRVPRMKFYTNIGTRCKSIAHFYVYSSYYVFQKI